MHPVAQLWKRQQFEKTANWRNMLANAIQRGGSSALMGAGVGGIGGFMGAEGQYNPMTNTYADPTVMQRLRGALGGAALGGGAGFLAGNMMHGMPGMQPGIEDATKAMGNETKDSVTNLVKGKTKKKVKQKATEAAAGAAGGTEQDALLAQMMANHNANMAQLPTQSYWDRGNAAITSAGNKLRQVWQGDTPMDQLARGAGIAGLGFMGIGGLGAAYQNRDAIANKVREWSPGADRLGAAYPGGGWPAGDQSSAFGYAGSVGPLSSPEVVNRPQTAPTGNTSESTNKLQSLQKKQSPVRGNAGMQGGAMAQTGLLPNIDTSAAGVGGNWTQMPGVPPGSNPTVPLPPVHRGSMTLRPNYGSSMEAPQIGDSYPQGGAYLPWLRQED
jgi:hypothetical protein